MLTALRLAILGGLGLAAAGVMAGLVATVGLLACGMRRPRPQRTDDGWAVAGLLAGKEHE